MSRLRSYAIVGTGALGGYYGARLHHAGRPVCFLAHSDFDHIRRHGLRVESPEGDFSIRQPRVFGRPQDMPACDVALVALKSTQNPLLKDLLPPLLHSGSRVLVMQNGLGVDEAAAGAAPGHTVLGALAFVCSNKIGPGHIRHLDYGQIRIGEFSPDGRAAGVTPAVSEVEEDFRAAGISVEAEADLLLARWKKLVWNVPFNGLTVVLNARTDQLMKSAAARPLCRSLMEEVLRCAAAGGRTLDPSFIDFMMDSTDRMKPYAPSMKLDFDAGRPIELQAIYHEPIARAMAGGYEPVRMRLLAAQLQFLQASRNPGYPGHPGSPSLSGTPA